MLQIYWVYNSFASVVDKLSHKHFAAPLIKRWNLFLPIFSLGDTCVTCFDQYSVA